MSTSIRFLGRPSLRAMWSSTAALSTCGCHRHLPTTATIRSAHNHLPTLHCTRHLSLSQHSLAAAPSASPSPSDPSPEPAAAAVYRSIHSKLTASLQPSYLQLEDTSGGCGTFFRLLIASPLFDGQSLVRQHRLVKEAIKADIGSIHGLTIDTMTNKQYAERKKAADERRKAPLS